jgi:hypothetical protein
MGARLFVRALLAGTVLVVAVVVVLPHHRRG